MDKKKLSFKDIMINYGVNHHRSTAGNLYRYYFKEFPECQQPDKHPHEYEFPSGHCPWYCGLYHHRRL